MSNNVDTIEEAVLKIKTYVSKTTGIEPSDSEIARSLTKYFTLREIASHIRMERDEN